MQTACECLVHMSIDETRQKNGVFMMDLLFGGVFLPECVACTDFNDLAVSNGYCTITQLRICIIHAEKFSSA